MSNEEESTLGRRGWEERGTTPISIGEPEDLSAVGRLLSSLSSFPNIKEEEDIEESTAISGAKPFFRSKVKSGGWAISSSMSAAATVIAWSETTLSGISTSPGRKANLIFTRASPHSFNKYLAFLS
eukprot:Lithocolla_globosa_v1_NODE_3239_length_1724_cov_5.873577.p2 type:complete len:126 gc:universal NODE_3239_length_1724_cov_5.873577:680-1057(+)